MYNKIGFKHNSLNLSTQRTPIYNSLEIIVSKTKYNILYGIILL
jgi:hypothetical protein